MALGPYTQREKWRVEARASEYGGGKTTVVLAGGLHGSMWWWTVVGRTETRPTGYSTV
ncbi:hypothetical protein A2U01_0055041, partial [Trifolium medium]|nr:hypothetical protein [Trifolium medium]